MKKSTQKYCPNCEIILKTEVCPYCKVKAIDMEYPVLECREANIGFWNVAFPMMFALGFGFFFFVFVFVSIPQGNILWSTIFFLGILIIIGIISFIIAMRQIIRYLIVNSEGEEIEATVYGYLNDNVFFNGKPSKIVKLLIDTEEGPRFILYQLSDTKELYDINSKVKLLFYKKMFLIHKEEYYF